MARVPPACRRGLGAPPLVRLEAGDIVIEFGPWPPRRRARHLLPSFSALTDHPFSFRFEVSARVDGEWTPWAASVTVGPAEFFPSPAAPPLTAEIDLWRSAAPVESLRLRLRLRADDPEAVLARPWLVTLSASDLGPVEAAHARDAARLSVPALSQMAEGGEQGPRICSPTSVAMILGYWGIPVGVRELAAEVFHPALDRYGVWPAAIVAAARRGVLGYLLRFPDWESAAWCLSRGVPIVASVRYRAAELTGAAVAGTDGHLLVLTGCAGGEVLVNDPAAPDAAAVPRAYPVEEIVRVWLERAGVGYVLFPPS